MNEESKLSKFIGKQIEVGLIPWWYGGKSPLKFNLVEEKTGRHSCLFLTYNNANRIVTANQRHPGLKRYGDAIQLSFKTPSMEIIDKQLLECEDCLIQLIYGINQGGKKIDLVDFEVCYTAEYFIEDTSFGMHDYHCFRIKKEDLIKDEDFFGYVILKDYNESVYYDLWDLPAEGIGGIFRNVQGNYESEGMEFEIGKMDVTQIIIGVFPNCNFPQ